MNIAGVSAWGTVSHLEHRHWESMISINLMGPIHVIETFVPANGSRRPGRASGQRVLGRRTGGAAVARRLQRQQVRPARRVSEVLRFDLARHRIGVSVVVPGAVKTPLVQTVEIAGVDREHPQVRKWVERFGGHAVSPEQVADKILRGVARNRYLIYTSADIRALYAFKRVAWWPYSVAMRRVNVIFTRALRPSKTA